MTFIRHIRDIVAGKERHARDQQAEFFYAKMDRGFEILLSNDGVSRAMALCVHETDAQAIVTALELAHKAGAV